MKNSIILLLLLLSTVCFSQKTYLKIYQNESEKSVIMYPPGTTFELRNKDNHIVLKYGENPLTFDIDGDYVLTVFPDYKDESDVFKLSNTGKIELAQTIYYTNTSTNEYLYIDDKNVTAHKTLTDSKKNKGYKNLIFELSNGITFTYTDGKYNAKLNDKYLNVKGKYLIESKIGILKLSFNPKNGTVWWVFE